MPTPVKWSPVDFELINSESPEGEPWLTATPDGRFNLTFFESFLTASPAYTDIETRLYSATGIDTGLGPAPTFTASTTEHQGATAFFPDGRNVYVWTEEPNAGGGNLEDVYASIYVGQLVAVPRFLVSGGAGIQHDPVVAAGALGFVVALADDSVAGGRLILKFYNTVGGLITTVTDAAGSEGVNTASGNEDDYRDVEITALANGNYAVVWASRNPFDIWARIYSPTGVAQTGLIEIEPGGNNSTFPDVTALSDGRFLVTYEQYTFNTVRGRIFEADGTPSTDTFTIAADAANALNQQVQSAALNDGRFVTVWLNLAGNIEGQVMFADGTPDGGAFAINGDAAGNKGRPTVATLADGRFAVSWESGAGATQTIFTTIFDPREEGIVLGGTGLGDDYIGSAFSDTIATGLGNDRVDGAGGDDFLYGGGGIDNLTGGEGNDRLDGGGAADTMIGGLGNDTFIVDSTGDVVNELAGAGSGSDFIYASVTYTLAANTERLFLTGTTHINGTGRNGQADVLTGNAGNNILNGLTGNDVMRGGLGNDTYLVDSVLDVVEENTGAGTDSIKTTVTFTMSINTERLYLIGPAAIDGTGLNGRNDLIVGNNAANTLNGLTGNDTLTGSLGLDIFLFNTVLNATTNHDTITDFSVADDTIRLENAIFTLLAATGTLAANLFEDTSIAGQSGSEVIIYDRANGDLYYDTNGAGTAGGLVLFADVANNTALTAADFVVV